jgi:hypothetical protein
VYLKYANRYEISILRYSKNLKEDFMNEIKSGKELCNDFFNQLVERQDIDSKIAILFKDLYSKNQLTKTTIHKALKTLRQENQNEQQNKD